MIRVSEWPRRERDPGMFWQEESSVGETFSFVSWTVEDCGLLQLLAQSDSPCSSPDLSHTCYCSWTPGNILLIDSLISYESYIYGLHISAAISPMLTMTAAFSLYGNFWCVRLGRQRQEGNRDAVTSSGGVYSCLSVDQEVLGRFLKLSLWMKFGESVVGHALASGVAGTKIGDDSDRLFNVIHRR